MHATNKLFCTIRTSVYSGPSKENGQSGAAKAFSKELCKTFLSQRFTKETFSQPNSCNGTAIKESHVKVTDRAHPQTTNTAHKRGSRLFSGQQQSTRLVVMLTRERHKY